MKINTFLFPLVQLVILLLLLLIQWPSEQLSISLYINHWHQPWLDLLCLYGTYLGDGLVIFLACLIIYYFKPELAIAILFAYLLSSGITQALKHTFFSAFNRPLWHLSQLNVLDYFLPEGAEKNLANSFPSGHTTSAFAFFCSLSFFTSKWELKLAYLLIAFFVAFTRVYLLQHFMIDTMVGSIIGSAVSIFIYQYFYEKGKLKWVNYK